MASIADSRPAKSSTVAWRGRSGRNYTLHPEQVDAFALDGAELHLIARGNLVLWVGCRDDVVQDAESRTRFRLALGCADRAFRIDGDDCPLERLTMVWDLEGAEPAADPVAA